MALQSHLAEPMELPPDQEGHRNPSLSHKRIDLYNSEAHLYDVLKKDNPILYFPVPSFDKISAQSFSNLSHLLDLQAVEHRSHFDIRYGLLSHKMSF
jgi:hypothetical protein